MVRIRERSLEMHYVNDCSHMYSCTNVCVCVCVCVYVTDGHNYIGSWSSIEGELVVLKYN